jgi:hypothetical protein
MASSIGATMDSPSSDRNKAPILALLNSHNFFVQSLTADPSTTLSDPIDVLEIAAGAGVHSVHFTGEECTVPINSWWPTDPDELSRHSIEARRQALPSDIEREVIKAPLPLMLDENGPIEQDVWGPGSTMMEDGDTPKKFDLIVCVNMIHIAPWSATLGLLKMASARLTQRGSLYIYGPFKEKGTASPGNLEFDVSLKGRNAEWGVRDLEEIIKVAESEGMVRAGRHEMPANNLSIVFRNKGGKRGRDDEEE